MEDIVQKQVDRAVDELKRLSEKETDSSKKLSIDYAITLLTNQAYGSMPF